MLTTNDRAIERDQYIDDIRAKLARLAGVIDGPAKLDHWLRAAEGEPWLPVDWHDADDRDDHDGWRLTLNRNEGGQDWVIPDVATGYEDVSARHFVEEATAEIASPPTGNFDRSVT